MFKALLKKQFMEVMNLDANKKNKKDTSKKNKKTNLIVWIFALGIVCIAFFFWALGIAGSLISAGHSVLYFSIMLTMSIFFGAFGSVFNTFNSLYLSKDNEMLFSMPINPKYILLTRMISVYLLSMLYSGIIWVPTIIVGYIYMDISFAVIVYPIVLIFFIALFVSILTCALGGLVAYLSTKFKKSRIITIILSVLLMVGLYSISFNMSNIMQVLMTNAGDVESVMKSWLAPMYYVGLAACGGHLEMLISCATIAALAVLTYYVLDYRYLKIVTTKISTKKKEYKKEKLKKESVLMSLIKKEFNRFFGSTVYLLNCGVGAIMALILGVIALVKMNSIELLLLELSAESENIKNMIPGIIAGVTATICSMNIITAPSISLEGNNLWLIKVMPIETKDILKAKVLMAVIYNSACCFISNLLFSIAFKVNIIQIIFIMISSMLFVVIIALVGILANLKMPNFSWTNEVVPIKQGTPILITMVCSMIGAPIIFFGASALGLLVSSYLYMFVLSLFLLLGVWLLQKLLATKGVEMFNNL